MKTKHKIIQAIAVAASALLLLQLGGCNGQARQAKYRERGAAYLAQKNYEKARVELNNALQINPKDATARYLVGQVVEKLGSPRDAVGDYRAAIELDPKLVGARAALGRLYLFANEAAKAQELAEEGLALSPGEPQLLTVRGAARAQQGDRAAAILDAEAAARVAPDDQYVVALLTSLYRQDGQTDKALAEATRGVEHNPSDVDLRYVLADLLLSAGRQADAEAQLRKIVELEPLVLAHRVRLARYYLQQKNAAAAEQAIRNAVAAVPDSDDAKLVLVQLIASARGAPAAEGQIRTFLAASADNDTLRLSFADYFQQAKNPDEAQKLYEAVIAHAGTRPEGLTARTRLAAVRLANNDSAQAGKLVAEVLKVSPRAADALAIHAQLALQANDAPTAITDLRSILRDRPNYGPAMRMLASAHRLNNENRLAEEVLHTALQASPKDTQTGMQLLQLLGDEGKQADALKFAQQLSKISPANVAIQEELFRLQLVQKDYQGAHDTVVHLQSIGPTAPLGYYLGGLLEETLNHRDAALSSYEHALQIQPDVVQPLVAAVRLDLADRKPERALKRIDAILAANPQHVFAKNLKGEVLLSGGRYAEAQKQFNDAILQSPKWPVPYRGLALTQLALKQNDEATATLNRGLEATGGDAELTTQLATLYEAQGKADNAIKLYDDFLKRNPKSLAAMNNLATLLASYRSDKTSLERAQQLVVSLNSATNPNVLDTRGWVAFKTGAYAQAVPLLQQALDKYPDSPLLHYRLGMAQLRSGDVAAARHNLEVAVQSGKSFLGADEARTALGQIKGSG